MTYLADQPIHCVIQVAGPVDPTWLADLVGLSVTEINRQDELLVLRGKTTDQAALVGLVNTLYSFGLSIVRMHCFPSRVM